MRMLTLLLFLCFAPGLARSQAQRVADPKDVATVEAIIAAVYDVISGPAGRKRDWDRMRSLFIDGARLIPAVKRSTGEVTPRVMTVEDFIDVSGPALENNGFFEKEIARKTEAFGSIVHVFSTYASRRNANDARPFARGINSFQLMNDRKRWWIVTIFWQAETPDNPIPTKYLPR